jgi:hypothetical protein
MPTPTFPGHEQTTRAILLEDPLMVPAWKPSEKTFNTIRRVRLS